LVICISQKHMHCTHLDTCFSQLYLCWKHLQLQQTKHTNAMSARLLSCLQACNVEYSSVSHEQQHLSGQKHKKKMAVEETQQGRPALDCQGVSILTCTLHFYRLIGLTCSVRFCFKLPGMCWMPSPWRDGLNQTNKQ